MRTNAARFAEPNASRGGAGSLRLRGAPPPLARCRFFRAGELWSRHSNCAGAETKQRAGYAAPRDAKAHRRSHRDLRTELRTVPHAGCAGFLCRAVLATCDASVTSSTQLGSCAGCFVALVQSCDGAIVTKTRYAILTSALRLFHRSTRRSKTSITLQDTFLSHSVQHRGPLIIERYPCGYCAWLR